MQMGYTAIFLSLWSMRVCAAEPRLGLYLVTKSANDLQQMELAGSPLISEADIIEYNWTNHTMRITGEAAKRIPTNVGTGGKAFVIVADGQRAYRGAFWISVSSIGCPYPIIDVLGTETKTTIKIERDYPGGHTKEGPDPRNTGAVQKVLRETGKLKEK